MLTSSNLRMRIIPMLIFVFTLFSTQLTFAHCDSYDGPVIKGAIIALETNNVELTLKWVAEDKENEIRSLFKKTYNLKSGDQEIYKIVEKHFFETLVRLHRETEGEPYTGLKPAGSTSKIVQMADNSIVSGDVTQLLNKFTLHIKKVIEEKHHKLMELSEVKNESIEKGRLYVAAYVDYTHTLERIHKIILNGVSHHSNGKH